MADCKICKIESCDNPACLQGLCKRHYHKLKRYGDPLGGNRYPQLTGCQVIGCDLPHRAHGLCETHHHRWKKYGDPFLGRISDGEPLKWLKAHLGYSNDDCLKWPFARSASGRALINFQGKYMHAARAICKLMYGAPPSEYYEAAHSCGKGHEGCVNPKHLRWATPKENQGDRLVHGTHNRGERSSGAKLTATDVLAIRAYCGLSQRTLADMFGVSDVTIGNILNRKTWKDIDPPWPTLAD